MDTTKYVDGLEKKYSFLKFRFMKRKLKPIIEAVGYSYHGDQEMMAGELEPMLEDIQELIDRNDRALHDLEVRYQKERLFSQQLQEQVKGFIFNDFVQNAGEGYD